MVNLLIQWYFANKRPLPWRETTDPYTLWVSEIILQQTRVAQGTDYYSRFLERFPSVFDLADASEDEVLKIWQGLGYYSRARNMHAAAKDIVSRLGGMFPCSYAELLKIKGVGPYTAAAVASFASQEAVPAVDGNVHRVLARLFGIGHALDSSAFRKEVHALASGLMDVDRPDVSNQAWMELGALVCTPVHPECGSCPLSQDCVAFRNGLTDQLPAKAKKTKVQSRFFHYLVVSYRDDVFIRQRPAGDIWQGLYEFPMVEADNFLSVEELMMHRDIQEWIGASDGVLHEAGRPYKHRLSHRLLHAVFSEWESVVPPRFPANFIRVPWKDVHEYAVPRLIENYLISRKP